MSYYGTGFPPGVMPMTPPAPYGSPGMPAYGPPAMPPQPFMPQASNFPGYPQPYGVGPMMSGSGQPPTDIFVRRPC